METSDHGVSPLHEVQVAHKNTSSKHCDLNLREHGSTKHYKIYRIHEVFTLEQNLSSSHSQTK